ncbi:septal ring lytic transglycosylase RlpA family protein [Dactylosporangium sp. CA-139066]|uniref:septal ring lytic transglycosylase RlpA family protein n=1 Tax=Dactylosporangium sp. CA-139066 TaxID=3239930 RepID=UPI003D8E3FF0
MSRRQLIPLIAGIAAVVALVGGAVATVNLRSDAKPEAAVDANRSPQERADRGNRPESSPSASTEAAATPDAAGIGSAPSTAAASPSASKKPKPSATTTTATGVASTGSCKVSYYSDGQNTASGEPFNPDAMTAANKEWKFGTQVRVTNQANGKSVVVTINDRGPYVSGRCIDLSRGAFQKIASLNAGVITARYEVLK